MKKAVNVFSFPLLAVMIAGCATQHANQFETFETAGKSYADAMVILTSEAGHVAIDADSELLLKDRDDLSSSDRTQIYQDRTKALIGLLDEFGRLRKHTQLLKSYFAALSALSESDAASGIGEEATELVVRLQEIHPSLAEATIGEAQVKDFMGEAIPLVVASFKQQALERELKRNAKTLERELELQSAMLEAMAIEMSADLKAIADIRTYTEVAKPYIDNGKIPSKWKTTRREILSTYVVVASADNAAKAAKELKKTFVALVEDKADVADFDNLFSDINAMLDLIELTQATTEE